MLDAKAIARRIKRAQRTFSVGGDLMLSIQLEHATVSDLQTLKGELTAKGIDYPALNTILDRKRVMATNPSADLFE